MIELAVILIGGMIANALSQQRTSARAAWSEAATELGLVPPASGALAGLATLRIAGRIGGHALVVEEQRQGSNRHAQSTATTLRLAFREPLPVDMRLYAEDGFTGLARLVGIDDLAVGDPAFDRAVRVQADEPDALRAWLTSGRRQRIRRFVEGRRGAHIERTGLRWNVPFLITDPKRLAAEVRYGIALANGLMPGAEPEAVDVAAEHLAHGDAGAAVEALRGDVDRTAFDALVLEGQALHAAGRDEEAMFVFRRAERAARHLGSAERAEARDGLRAAKRALARARRTGARGRKGDDANTRAAQAAAAADPGPDIAALSGDLFGPAGHAPDVGERFDATYRGQRVRWTGTLLSAEEAGLDFVFGDRPLCRAVFHVHGADRSALAFDAVRAVVRLPAGSTAALGGRVGQRMTIAGTLVACDTFGRNLYLDDGSFAPA